MMNRSCDISEYQLSAYLDEELDENEEQLIQSHLDQCLICSKKINALRRTSEMVADVLSTAPDIDFDAVLASLQSDMRRTSSLLKIWMRVKQWLPRPVLWVPAAVVGTIVLLITLSFPIFYTTHLPSSRTNKVISVFSRTGNVMIFQSAQIRQPIIWIFEKPMKEPHS